ncbi:WD repeat-containing protein 6 isoform X2 [Topomyia yanbarensis]|nr:WD repeat-containing protein 6 isoform X2 [Topomyia yanbarensis]
MRSKIHGIDFCTVDSSWLIVLHAGRKAISIALNQDDDFYDLTNIDLQNFVQNVLYYPKERTMLMHSPSRFNDWISTLKLLDRQTIGLITGHGVAILLTRNYFGDWLLVDSCPCEDSSTLFYSRIVGSSWTDLLCFSGTALGLLVIWRPSGVRKGRVLSSSRAHNGVIFSIDCDWERGFLTTASDDRSVKFWTIRSHPLPEDFGIELEEKSYCFGHTARVFQCRIIRERETSWVVSIGEDSNLCLWDDVGNLIVKKRLEDGATLWNLDYDAAQKIMFVCASNGNVSQINLEGYLTHGRCSEKDIHSVEVDVGKEHLVKVKFLSNGSLVAITDHDQVMLLADCSPPQIVDQLDNFKCSLLDASEKQVFIAGDKYLNIYQVNDSSIKLIKKMVLNFDQPDFLPEPEPVRFSIIRSLHFCSKSNIVLCDNNGRCLVYGQNVEILQSCHRLPKASEPWLTFAFGIEENLLLADRAGNLLLYNNGSLDPLYKLSHLHDKLGITGIRLEESTEEGYFLTTSGHDGHLRSIFLDPAEKIIQVYGAEKMPIRWIDRMSELCNDLWLMGFNDSRFVLCDRKREILFQIDCGGGHRNWDFFRSDDKNGRFVFIQHKRLREVSVELTQSTSGLLRVPRLNWHVKTCNAVRIVQTEEAVLFISGGEDNVLRIHTFCSETGSLLDHPRKHLTSHISSIKSICHSTKLGIDKRKVLLISAGGRAQLCLTTLDTVTLRTKDELSYMLLASDSDRSRWRSNRTLSFDPETRFMCMTLVESIAGLFVGCSDGFLRQFKLSINNGSYQVELAKEIYYGRCFLHITSLIVENKLVILTTATDGLVCFWDAQKLSEPFHKLRYHASGINAFDVMSLDHNGLFLLGTGGDDQAVLVSVFRINTIKSGGFCFQLRSTIRQQCAHLGQVTGIRFIDEHTFWSVGIDQEVCLWHFTSKTMSIGKTFPSCVSDAKGLEKVLGRNEVFVYGCGFEFIRVTS